MNKMVEKLKKEEQKVQSDNVDAKHKMDNCHSEYKSKLHQVKGWTEKLSTLEYQEVPGEAFGCKSPRRPGSPSKSPRSPRRREEPSPTPKEMPGEGDAPAPMDQEQPTTTEGEGTKSGGDGAEATPRKSTLTRKDLPNLDSRFPIYSQDQLEEVDDRDLVGEIDTMEKNVGKMKPNMGAIKEYEQKERVYIERAKDLEEVTVNRDEMKGKLEEVKTMRLTEFKTGFNVIARRLKEMYRMVSQLVRYKVSFAWVDKLFLYFSRLHLVAMQIWNGWTPVIPMPKAFCSQ